MKKREWVEIQVYFDDNWIHTLRRKDLEPMGADLLKLDSLHAIRELGKVIDAHLGEAEG